VFTRDPERELVRRLYLPGGPCGIALDAEHGRLFVTLPASNEVVELPAYGRPHVLRRWPTVRQPNSVAVDPVTRRVYVAGLRPSALQVLSAVAPLR
jgi:DNA-binding beta-propeller fold protein YncE